MKLGQNSKKQPFLCTKCGGLFFAKRGAKFCSPLCYERNRERVKIPSAKIKIWREKRLSQPGYRERVNAVANANATKIRRWLDEYKLFHGCCDCGFKIHPSALHFDHIVSDKKMNVCDAKSIKAAQAEIKKCVIRCANCHAIKTWPNRLLHK